MFYPKYEQLCKNSGYSPSGGAIAAGFSKGTVSVWKKKYIDGEDVRPEKDVLEKITQFFNCSESWLLDIEKTPIENDERITPEIRELMDICGDDPDMLKELLDYAKFKKANR